MSENPEQHRRATDTAERENRWREQNRDAIASINAFIDRHDLLASRLRYRPEPG